ncbi:MAG: general glycosylation pathway protein [Campylobacter sp.]|nr:general glycosylation pathway protein [Campylobacter sp.]
MKDINFNSRRWLVVFIFITFAFGVIARLYWVNWASEFPELIYNDQVMINTNDGYAFAEGARDLIAGFHQLNDLSYVWSPLSKLTVLIYKITPFSFETIILYMSAFFSSLIVMPILLIARLYKATEAGVIAAASAVVAVSYYNRTMAGYYDTDMLNIVFALFVLWGLIRVVVKQDRGSIIIAPIFALAYYWWYPSSFTIVAAMTGIFFIYTLVFERKSIQNYQTLILLVLALTSILVPLRLVLMIGLYAIFMKKDSRDSLKMTALLGLLVGIIFLAKGGLNPIWFMLKFYVIRDTAEVVSSSFYFFSVNQTIQESGSMAWEYFMTRISSHPFFFVLGLIGCVLLFFRHKSFIISLPILGLGLLSYKAGLRFTIYAVPIMALGLGYLIYYLLDLFKVRGALRLSGIFALAILCVWPALGHIRWYKSPTVFFSSEVAVLDYLKSIANREDYVVAWWDYGYPIRYYSDVKTLIDGGKHLGDDNFPVSFALLKDGVSSANMSRLAVEYTERSFYDKNISSILDEMLKNYSISDVNDFLIGLSIKDFTLPQPTRDIYYYLPRRMISIFNVVNLFSNIDLATGKSFAQPFFASAYFAENTKDGLVLDNGVMISNDMKTITLGSQNISIRSFYETKFNEKLEFSSNETIVDPNGLINIIVLNDGMFVLADNQIFNSTYVQLFMLERYDPEIYEIVISTPMAKVYRLKR